jgi:hypothetical protein
MKNEKLDIKASLEKARKAQAQKEAKATTSPKSTAKAGSAKSTSKTKTKSTRKPCPSDKCKQYTKIPAQYAGIANKFIKIRNSAPRKNGFFSPYVDRALAADVPNGNKILREMQAVAKRGINAPSYVENLKQLASALEKIVKKHEKYAK